MSYVQPCPDGSDRRERLRGLALAVTAHLLLGYALVVGLRVTLPTTIDRALTLVDLRPPQPPPRVTPPPPRQRPHARRAGAASAPNLVADPTPLVAPVPVITLPTPPVMVTAPIAGNGAAPSAGAAPVAGPGTGSGGEGDGRGGGGAGDGDGGTPLRLVSGSLEDRDYPRAALAAGIEGVVGLRFVVGIKGRVSDCVVTRSSGDRGLDEATCRLIEQRLRYRPTLDSRGRPIPDIVTGEHRWTLHRRDDDRDDDGER
ncbi:energy transducer TonB [Sphingomonas sp. Tas61C01]|uniref:energy transducer TonB n=1 Tax=Sphingomonas sp. Tas61C01 TaxID=3458297 RepID=UPI00403ED5EC